MTEMSYRLVLPWGSSAVCMHDDAGDVQCAEVSRVWLSPFLFLFDSLGRSDFLLSTAPPFLRVRCKRSARWALKKDQIEEVRVERIGVQVLEVGCAFLLVALFCGTIT